MKTLYLDESGNANMKRIDSNYPVFAFGGVIIDSNDMQFNMQIMNDFKKKFFGTNEIILHSSEIVRLKNSFSFLKNPSLWAEFLHSLNHIMDIMKYRVKICIFDKKKFGPNDDLYEISFSRFIESFDEEIRIIAESAGKITDAKMMIAFGKSECGCKNNFLADFNIQSKTKNMLGLQLADLVLPPVVRHHMGRSDTTDYRIVMKKCDKNSIMII
ncbi:MAG: DUF3800 domain-containing protein [Rickettsiales bacterium]|jgi:hypothetical protein|nr:DUF3800 domain-containing protein [Rickettsiales bacterium]